MGLQSALETQESQQQAQATLATVELQASLSIKVLLQSRPAQAKPKQCDAYTEVRPVWPKFESEQECG